MKVTNPEHGVNPSKALKAVKTQVVKESYHLKSYSTTGPAVRSFAKPGKITIIKK